MQTSHSCFYDAGLCPLIDRFVADRDALGRRYRLSHSEARRARMARLVRDWEEEIRALPFDSLSSEAKIDRALFLNHLTRTSRTLDREAEKRKNLEDAVP